MSVGASVPAFLASGIDIALTRTLTAGAPSSLRRRPVIVPVWSAVDGGLWANRSSASNSIFIRGAPTRYNANSGGTLDFWKIISLPARLGGDGVRTALRNLKSDERGISNQKLEIVNCTGKPSKGWKCIPSGFS